MILKIGLTMAAIITLAITLSACRNDTPQADTAAATATSQAPANPTPTTQQQQPGATSTPTLPPSPEPTPRATATPMPTPTPTLMPTATSPAPANPTPTTRQQQLAATSIPTLPPSPEPTPTLMPTATPAPTPTPESTATPTPIPPTPTPAPIATATPIPSAPTHTLLPLHNTQNTRWLKSGHPALYRQIQALPWIKDGTTETEREAVDYLLYLGAVDIASMRAALSLAWVQDEITDMERDAIKQLRWLKDEDDENGIAVIKAVLAFPWIQDGITEMEGDAIDRIEDLDDSSETAAAAIIAMPWVQDGITDIERDAINELRWLKDEDDENGIAVIEAVLAFPWIQDGITEMEGDAIDRIEGLDDKSEAAADAIIAMPFLESLEADDVLAIRGIRRLARDTDDGRLDALMAHPTFRKGITDSQTILVTAAATIREADEIQRFLNPGYADIETTSTGTKLTPDLKISIVRTGTQPQPWTMQAVKNAVEFAERTMQLPLTISHVIFVLNDKAFTENSGGTNFGFAFGYNPDREQVQDTYDGFLFQSGIVHETAHYFWSGYAGWISEGVADTFEFLYGAEIGVSPGLLETPRRKKCETPDLETLMEIDPDKQDSQFRCNYFLGQMLFLELLENLGAEEFNQRLRELYRLGLATKEAGEIPGIVEVRQTFQGQTDFIDRHWSGKLNAPENRPFDEGVSRRSHDQIQWDQYPIYDGGSVTFSGTLLGDAVLSSETIDQARNFGKHQNFILRPTDDYRWVGNILPPLDDNRHWNLDDPGDTVATEYRLEDRVFAVRFPFSKALDDPSDYVVIVRGFEDESRDPYIGEKIDTLGYARIRTQ